MIRNFFLITFRNFLRYKYFTGINLLGLALGLSCSIFILLWITDEMKYDAFHVNRDRLYRVLRNETFAEGALQTSPSTPGILAAALKSEVPEISHAIQMTWEIQELVTIGPEAHKEPGRYASPDFLEMFSYPLVYGDVKTALVKPTSIIISQKMAQRYFGKENPMGKLVTINNKNEYEITGVFQDTPANSSIRFEFVVPFEAWSKSKEWIKQWENYGPRTFVMLAEGVTEQTVNAKIRDFIKRKLPKENIELSVQRYDEMYLYSDFKNGHVDGGRIDYVKSFSIVAIVVLAIACINFMNLATARALKRAKEIGIRKVNGAARKVLIIQFIGEATLFAFIGLAFALMIVELLLPLFRQITQKEVALNLADPVFALTLVCISLVTGLLSGVYPAFFLSSFNIVNVLKGAPKVNPRSLSLRKGLVIFQFCLTIFLIFCTLVVYRQIEYIKNKNLGFDRENLILLQVATDRTQKISEISARLETVVTETVRQEGILSATFSTTSPLVGGDNTIAVDWPGKTPDDKILFTQMAVGYDYTKTMGIQLKEGRDFSRDIKSDSVEYMVNEETVRRMRLADPLGQQITFWGTKGTIVGIMKDYHVNSLHTPIEPVILHFHPEWSNVMIVRVAAGKTPQAIEGLSSLASLLNPSYPFEYHFLDETFDRQYRSETTVGTLANYFSVLAIFISCLGLLGLIIFTAEQRTKEIGVRKVLGATVQSIILLLSKDLIVLVIIAFTVSAPLAWYMMDQWLHNYAYRIDIGWWVFLASGMASIVIAFLTVSLQALKAAIANPVNSLRNE